MSNNLTKREIVEAVYRRTQMSRADISATLDIVLEVMAKAILDGRNIELRNFSVFRHQLEKVEWGAIQIVRPIPSSYPNVEQ
jgi:nucleoid DNA-binding protein